MKKAIGVAFLVAGVMLLLRGHDAARSVNSQVRQLFTGSPTDRATYLYLGGAVLSAVGLFQIFWSKK